MVAVAMDAATGGAVNNNAVVTVGNDKFCGRILGVNGAMTSESICSKFPISNFRSILLFPKILHFWLSKKLGVLAIYLTK